MRNINPIMHRWQEIIAILPQYDKQDRDITRFYFVDGSHCDFYRSIQTAIAEVCKYLNVNQKQLLTASAAYLNGRTRKIPLSLMKKFCLIPITCRKECYNRKHSPIGYIILDKVDVAVREGAQYTTITFINSCNYLTFPQSSRTVNHQLELALSLVAYFRHY